MTSETLEACIRRLRTLVKLGDTAEFGTVQPFAKQLRVGALGPK